MRASIEAGPVATPTSAPPAPILLGRDRFTRELTPTWLATATLLAGVRPPEVAGMERYLLLGCGRGETAAVVAASHPAVEVVVWDPRPEYLDATLRLARAAGLANVVVHEDPGEPLALVSPADVVVVHELMARADDDLRGQLVRAIRAALRSGALLCVTYPTLVGWAEVAPVVALLQRLAAGPADGGDAAVSQVLDLLARLRAGGARYLVDRPIVAAWLDHLQALPGAELASRYLREPFRPMSPAEVDGAIGTVGCDLVGSAILTDALDASVAPDLASVLHSASNTVLRETYHDLAVRRTHRVDVFGLGLARLDHAERDARVCRLGLAGLAVRDEQPAVSVPAPAWRQLMSFGVEAGELHDDPREVSRIVRLLLDAGQAHPMVPRGPGRAALEACEALNAALADVPTGGEPSDVHVIALLGSAVSAARWALMGRAPTSPEHR